MNRHGFSIVELIVVITVMSALLLLGIINFNGTQANARDSERKADIESITSYLETYYKSGNDDSTSFGIYPSTDLIGNETTFFRDFDTNTIKSPSLTSSSLIDATNNIQTIAGILPQPTIDQYVYQPIATDGSLCDDSLTQECRKFNLYYRLEVDNSVNIVTSKNQ